MCNSGHVHFAAYDVTRRATFDSIAEVWMKEVDMYSTVDDAVKMVVGNKIDMVRWVYSYG